MPQGEVVRALEGKVDTLQKSADSLAGREETTRIASGDVSQRLRAAESALQQAHVELDAVRWAMLHCMHSLNQCISLQLCWQKTASETQACTHAHTHHTHARTHSR